MAKNQIYLSSTISNRKLQIIITMIYHNKQRCLHRCLLQLKTNAEKRNLRGTSQETKASKGRIILSILLVILAIGYFAGTWYLKQKNEGTK